MMIKTKMKPIIFSAPLIPAIRNLKPNTWPPKPIDPAKPFKYMTRRVVKWEPYHDGDKINFNASSMSLGHYCTGVPESGYVLYSRGHGVSWNQRTKPMHCPYPPGTQLYVKETWQDMSDNKGEYVYLADGNKGLFDKDWGVVTTKEIKWRPSIHMPRAAARLFLEVKNVRPERVQEITEDDARAERVKDPYDYQSPEYYEQPHMKGLEINKSAFAGLWDSIYAKRGYPWKNNPWVFVYEFMRIDKKHREEQKGDGMICASRCRYF